jgi:endonuclease/exonuclease/phosphatase family metal-dependent hydrolase
LFQVQRLLAWIGARGGADAQIICGDFNAPPETPAAELMAENFATSQTAPTAFTPLADENGAVSHPYWERFDRCIDYIWHSESLRAIESGVCFDRPHPDDNSLWPSDHAGVWADFDFVTKR